MHFFRGLLLSDSFPLLFRAGVHTGIRALAYVRARNRLALAPVSVCRPFGIPLRVPDFQTCDVLPGLKEAAVKPTAKGAAVKRGFAPPDLGSPYLSGRTSAGDIIDRARVCQRQHKSCLELSRTLSEIFALYLIE